jgi:hypothetical protein
MKARTILLGAAAAVAFIPALSLSASASKLPARQFTMNTNCASVVASNNWANNQTSNWRNRCRPPGILKLYISAPYQDNGVTVVNLWWTAPVGATSYSLIVNENTAAGPDSFTGTGLPQSTQSNPFIVQVEGDTTLVSATFQVTDNKGDVSNIVTYP